MSIHTLYNIRIYSRLSARKFVNFTFKYFRLRKYSSVSRKLMICWVQLETEIFENSRMPPAAVFFYIFSSSWYNLHVVCVMSVASHMWVASDCSPIIRHTRNYDEWCDSVFVLTTLPLSLAHQFTVLLYHTPLLHSTMMTWILLGSWATILTYFAYRV